jgi:hypothetical protein
MKKLVLAFATLISTVSFSQVITVTWNNTKAFNFYGNTAEIPEFAAAGKQVFNADGKGKKVINLNTMEQSFFEDGVYMNTLKIKKYSKFKDKIMIVLIDYDIRTGAQLETYQILDLKTNISYYSWYYNDLDQTWVYNESGGNISIK